MLKLTISALALQLAATPPKLEFSATRLGPITAALVPSTKAVRLLFPDAEIEEQASQGEGGFEDGGRVWVVRESGKLLLDLYQPASGTWFVVLLHPVAATREGLGVGSPVDRLLAQGPVTCEALGTDDGQFMTCWLRSTPNIKYTFEPTAAEMRAAGPLGKMPDGFVPERGRARSIDQIYWEPPPRKASETKRSSRSKH